MYNLNFMEKYLLVSIILIVVSFLYLKIAKKTNIVDKPNHRSSHTKTTVRGGGIIFPIAILLFFFLNDFKYSYFVLGVVLISIVSFLDDIYTLSAKVRFPFQVLSIFLILYQVALPFSPIYIYLLSFFIGIGLINTFNFMDGINGITGIYSMSVLFGFYLINHKEQIVLDDLILYSAISLLVFGFYNFRKKALFFAGDIGSIAIGMLIFFLGIFFVIKLSSPLILFLIIVYGADATCTIIYRKLYTKESLFDPHRHHIYQKIVDVYKMSHIKVSAFYGVIQLVVNYIIFKTYMLSLNSQLFVFVSLTCFFTFLYIFLFYIISKKIKIKNA